VSVGSHFLRLYNFYDFLYTYVAMQMHRRNCVQMKCFLGQGIQLRMDPDLAVLERKGDDYWIADQ